MSDDIQPETWSRNPYHLAGASCNGNGFHFSSPASSNDIGKDQSMLSPFDYATSEPPDDPCFAIKAGRVSCFCVASEESPMELVVKQKSHQRNSSSKEAAYDDNTWHKRVTRDIAWPLALNSTTRESPARGDGGGGYAGEVRKSPLKSGVERNLDSKFEGTSRIPDAVVDLRRQSPSMAPPPGLSPEWLSPTPGTRSMEYLSMHLPMNWADQSHGLGDNRWPSNGAFINQRGAVPRHSPGMAALSQQLTADWGDG